MKRSCVIFYVFASSIFCALLLFSFPHDASAALAAQSATGPWTNADIKLGYADFQFYSPVPVFGANTATYDYNCSDNDDPSDPARIKCVGYPPYASNTYICSGDVFLSSNSAWLFYGCVADTVAPAIVQNVQAVGVLSSAINVTWDPATDNVGVIGYRVLVLQGTQFIQIGTVLHTGAAAYAFTDGLLPVSPATSVSGRTLTPSTNYAYGVVAYDAANNASSYAPVWGTTLAAPAPTVTAINPASGYNNASVAISSVTGTNFLSGATVKLTRTGQPDIACSGFTFSGSAILSNGTCPITGAATGQWNVVVTNTDGQSGTFANGFTISLLPSYSLSVTIAGTGTGSVSGSMSCGTGTCTSSFISGTSITLTATPSGGSTFAGWSGASCTGTGSCTFAITANSSVTATFTLLPPTVTTSAPTLVTTSSATLNSSVNPNGNSATGWFQYSTVNPGSCNDTFGIRVPLSGGTSLGSGTSPVNDSRAISGLSGSTWYYYCAIASNAGGVSYGSVVSFLTSTASYSISVATAGTGTGSIAFGPAGTPCGTNCVSYLSGIPVTLTASPSGGSIFAGWSSGTGSASACTGTGSCAFAVTANSAVTATFNLPSYALVVTTAGTGTGTIAVNPPTGPYVSGTLITLTATPSGGSTFAGFSGACVSAATTCTFTITANSTVTATFSLPSHALAVTTAGTGTGTVTSSPAGINCPGACSAFFVSGTAVTLVATPNSGFSFTGWSGACTGTGTCSVTMDAAKSVTATFDDTAAPIFTLTSPMPPATFPAGVASVTLSGNTSEPAVCTYNSIAFGPSATTHSRIFSSPASGTYTYTIECTDAAGNVSGITTAMFTVDNPILDMTPPTISASPSGVLASSAAGSPTTIVAVTGEPATLCKYSLTQNPVSADNTAALATLSAMPGSFTMIDPTHFSALTNPLIAGMSYMYYIRCQDTAGNNNLADYTLSFSVAASGNQVPIASFTVNPSTSGIVPFTIDVNASASLDPDGTIAAYIWNWGDGFATTSVSALDTHTYQAVGTYTLTLIVVDNGGLSGSSGTAYETITVSALPPPPSATTVCLAQCSAAVPCVSPNICGPSGVCINPAGVGGGPLRFDGATSLLDGSDFQYTPAVYPAGTTALIMNVRTDVNATCQYILNTPGTFYGATTMKNFTATGGKNHSVKLTGLKPGGTLTAPTPLAYDYYVKCKDVSTGTGEFNTTDYPVSFTISNASMITAPGPYTCLINQSFVKNGVPYFFDICYKQCATSADCTAPATCDAVKKVCR
ncbi:hypothetical protein A2988_02990 [Candidatus Azambacteria bacterium RIFCSPLOWO2_01_FULL_46_25]|uniref:PKD domain-containing protein n=1 Tax=Candidatus Azambacteria bacterium RIFCSPLOWO2_01_FULL_46_25 TaxID=1797298 RepID=A0A1F5BV24_9BACT|nr:MAG: hypothetical protein A2988_02990 [Candidatus Azambacteria bacterium RIFCSPLOWO2_01_FULL_46_25]